MYECNTSQVEILQSMIEFFCPILEPLCPLFVQIAQIGLICPDGDSLCLGYPHQPLFFTQPSRTPFGEMYVHKTPQTPPENTPFPGLNLKVGQINHCLGKMDLNRFNWAKCLKSGQNFSRGGQNVFIHNLNQKCFDSQSC